jgi:ParB-like chromosome segregation protein Spo0J
MSTNTLELKINDKFKNLLPPLTDEEFKYLEESILQYGLINPILIWNGTIIDGHYRYKICLKYNIPIKTKEVQFRNEYEAIVYIIRNQLGMKNLTDYEKATTKKKLEETKAKKAGKNISLPIDTPKNTAKNDFNSNSETEKDFLNFEELIYLPANKLKKAIAKIAGVSVATVEKVKKIDANAIDEIKQELYKPNGKISINTAVLISELPKEQQIEIMKLSQKEIIKIAKELKAVKKAQSNVKSQKAKEVKNVLF